MVKVFDRNLGEKDEEDANGYKKRKDESFQSGGSRRVDRSIGLLFLIRNSEKGKRIIGRASCFLEEIDDHSKK